MWFRITRNFEMDEKEVSILQYNILGKAYRGFVRIKQRLYTWPYLSWLILFVSALNVICIGGKRRAFGIFIAALHSAYNETSMTELNWIGDSYASLGFFLMPFATTAILQLNRPYRLTMLLAGLTIFASCVSSAEVPDPGYLFLTHTLLHGIGSTLVLCGTSLITGDYFDKTHRFHVMATAFVSGGPYGVLIFGPLFSHWIQHYTWRNAFVYSGILFFCVTGLAAITFLPRYMYEYNQVWEESKVSEDRSTRPQELRVRNPPRASDGKGWAFCSAKHLRDNPQVFLWALERLFHNVVIYGLLMNMTDYVTKAQGNILIRGARVNLYFGLGESVIFTVGALIGDRIRGYLPAVYLGGAGTAALFLLILQRSYTDINVVYIMSGFAGASVGVGNTFLYATAEEVMLVHGSIAFPMTKMVAGVGMMVAPLFSGAIIDTYGYRGFFLSMAILVSIRFVLLFAICVILKIKSKRLEKCESERSALSETQELIHRNSQEHVTKQQALENPNAVLTEIEQRIADSSAWYKELHASDSK